ncbi:WD40 repeat-like protein [Rhizopogon vinicolor AM-OR11-026]|uniref:WD40 repeat-like protein n=1 Tax=Rhizopogon vinicolor AM-OR11-026 TaxID=1314800 RepID=A0A1B7N3Z3_9AGAM|nr:WD40 repeat-like protein [Rhizopogon vinicolor AM-OR11-026]
MTEEPAHPIVRSSTPVRAFDNIGDVAAVAVFPDRQRMATNSSDGMLRLWDLKNGVMLKEMDGHGAAMAEMALSRDGQLIASSDCAGYVFTWHGETDRPVTQAFKAHTSSCSLAFSPDGATLATGSSDSTIKLWSTETWQLQGQPINLGDSSSSVNCVRYSPSGEHLAIATQYAGIQIWDPVKKHRIANLGQGAASLVWTSDGTRLLSGDSHSIQQWHSSTWKQVGDIWKSNTSYPRRFAMNCNGTVVASLTTDNHVRLWRLSDRRTIAIFHHSDSPYCVTFSMDGKYILAGGKDKKILEWAVPEHAWPEDALKDQATRQGQDSDTKAKSSYTEIQDSETKACFHSRLL